MACPSRIIRCSTCRIFAQHASRDKFFLVIKVKDPKFNREDTRQFLESLNPIDVIEVPL